MQIVGVTLPPTSSKGHVTVLLRVPVSVLNSYFRGILPWFFCQSAPFPGVAVEGALAVRIKMNTDPFRHLRKKKGRAFDGKGITLERHPQRPEVFLLDHEIGLEVKQITSLLPGLLYGTENYRNLNCWVSERICFSTTIIDPTLLWDIMYDCLHCKSFLDRQELDGSFKAELWQKFHATQTFDFNWKLAELQEQINATAKRKELGQSLEIMFQDLRCKEAQKYRESMQNDMSLLQSISTTKQEKETAKRALEVEMDFRMIRECSQQKILIQKNVLECLLQECEEELNQSRANLEQRHGYDDYKRNIHRMLCNIQELHAEWKASSSGTYKLESARGSLETNKSLQLLANVSNADERALYLSNLKQQELLLCSRIAVAQNDEECKKKELHLVVSQIHEMKNRLQIIDASDPEQGVAEVSILLDSLCQIQANVQEISKATCDSAEVENQILKKEMQAWHDYRHITAVPFEELITIAAVRCVVESMGSAIEDHFQGFIYECAAEEQYPLPWAKDFSFRPIFKSKSVASHVGTLMILEHNVDLLGYIVMEQSKTINDVITNFAQNEIELIIDEEAMEHYNYFVAKVNLVVSHLMSSFQLKGKLKSIQDSRDGLIPNHEELLNELRRWISQHADNNFGLLKAHNTDQLVILMISCANATNKRLQLQAQCKALKELIQQIETAADDAPDSAQLKLEAIPLNEQLKAAEEEHTLSHSQYCELLRKLKTACDDLKFEIDRKEEDYLSVAVVSAGVSQKLMEHWETVTNSLRQALVTMDDYSNQTRKCMLAPNNFEMDTIEEEIQELSLKERTLQERVYTSENTLYEQLDEVPLATRRSHSDRRRQRRSDPQMTIDKIVQTQRELRRMPPALKPEEVERKMQKMKVLREVAKLQSNFRELCLNNRILPAIDKLQVEKLRHLSQLVAAASQDLPELEGTVNVFFSYRGDEVDDNDYNQRMSLGQASFDINKIVAVNVCVRDEDGVQLQEVTTNQQNLAFLLIFIGFLYADGCKLFIMHEKFQQLFENGLCGMVDVLTKHFRGMQFIILKGSNK